MTSSNHHGELNLKAAAFLIFLCAISFHVSAEPLAKHYKLIVVGAGPAGLTAVNAAVQFGQIKPEEILIIEKRDQGDAGLSNKWGSRHRVVVLDTPSAAALKSLAVPVPGAPFTTFIPMLRDGTKRYVPYSGAFKVNIGAPYGGREFSNLTTLKDLERNLLEGFESYDGKVNFGTTAKLKFDKDEQGYLMIGRKKVTADLIAWSAGSRDRTDYDAGELAKYVSTTIIDSNDTFRYLALDIPLTGTERDVKPGDEIAIEDSGVIAYAFVSDEYALLSAIIPVDLNKYPEERPYYLSILHRMARRIGFNGSPDKEEGTYYAGDLSMSNRTVLAKNVVLIGDAASSNDPISGAGANKAIQNGLSIGEYFNDVRRYGEEYALENLRDAIAQQTEFVFDQSLLFRDMADFLISKRGLADFTARLGGLSTRQGFSAVDISKQLFGFWINALVGSEQQGRLFNSLAAAGGAPIGALNERNRKIAIGTVHPDDILDGTLNTTPPKCSELVTTDK